MKDAPSLRVENNGTHTVEHLYDTGAVVRYETVFSDTAYPPGNANRQFHLYPKATGTAAPA